MTMDDGARVYVRVWTAREAAGAESGEDAPAAGTARGVLQIAHGMAEHIGRYEEFAEYLAERGFHVVGSDHRGHGRTGERAGLLGHFADEDGFERVVDDLRAVNDWIAGRWPGLPRFLMGHSMGSLLARRYMQRFGDTIDGAVLMGTPGHPGFIGKFGRWVSKLEVRRRGLRKPNPFLDRVAFFGNNKRIPNPKTDYDYLTRDEEAVAQYLADPLCGWTATSGFFVDLLTGLLIVHEDDEVGKIPKEMPVLFVNGSEDPIGDYGKGVAGIIAQFRRHGIRDVESILFEGARHEPLHEINKEEAYEAIREWLERKAAS